MPYAWVRRLESEAQFGDVVIDKERSANAYSDYMYTRLLQMFDYKNLPDTIPKDFLEYYLLQNGSCFVTEVDSQLWAFTGNPGGEPDPYYRPTLYVCSNPALGISFERQMWGDEGVFCVNDSMWVGLDPLIRRYAYLMAENLISMRSADIMLRIVSLISAHDDATKASADQYIKDLIDGKLSAIGDNPFFDGITLQSPPSNNGSYLTQFIELHQYYKGSFYNEIGLRANFNMKREAIGVGEAALGEDSLLPLCDNMLLKRKEFVEKINSLYGTEISVDFSSIWKDKRKEAELDLEQKEAEIDSIKSTVVNYDEREDDNGDDSESEEGEIEGEADQVEESEDSGDGSGMDENGDGESDEEVERTSDSESEASIPSENNVEVKVDVQVDIGEEEVDAGETERTEESE